MTNHSVAREVVTFFTLPPGDYIVVPQTNVPNCDGKFLLRILTDEQSNIWEVNEDNVLFRNVLVEFEEGFKYVRNIWRADSNDPVSIGLQIHTAKNPNLLGHGGIGGHGIFFRGGGFFALIAFLDVSRHAERFDAMLFLGEKKFQGGGEGGS